MDRVLSNINEKVTLIEFLGLCLPLFLEFLDLVGEFYDPSLSSLFLNIGLCIVVPLVPQLDVTLNLINPLLCSLNLTACLRLTILAKSFGRFFV